jgi:hypothetical protein
VRWMPCAVPGWVWNERIADLGPPPDLHARAQVWRADWAKHWPDYKRGYQEWMEREPCAGLISSLERRIKAGQTIALACWWCAAIG